MQFQARFVGGAYRAGLLGTVPSNRAHYATGVVARASLLRGNQDAVSPRIRGVLNETSRLTMFPVGSRRNFLPFVLRLPFRRAPTRAFSSSLLALGPLMRVARRLDSAASPRFSSESPFVTRSITAAILLGYSMEVKGGQSSFLRNWDLPIRVNNDRAVRHAFRLRCLSIPFGSARRRISFHGV